MIAPLGHGYAQWHLRQSGKELVYITGTQVLRRPLSEFEMQPLTATDLGGNLQLPVYSPDGQWLTYLFWRPAHGQADQSERRSRTARV